MVYGKAMRIHDTVSGLWANVPPEEVREALRFHWTEGNYSCDCNRALLLARALGVDDPDDAPCGDERYVLVEMPEGWEDRPQ